MIRILFLLLITVASFGAVIAQDSDPVDFQVWNETQFVFPLDNKKNWTASLSVVGRFGENVSRASDSRVGATLTRKVNEYLSAGAGYIYRVTNTSSRGNRYESRYLGIASITVPLTKKWTLLNRNLYQYEDRYSRPNQTTLRSRVGLRRGVTIKGRKIEPFGTVEVFYNATDREIFRYRTQLGVSRKFSDKFSADIFYLRQDETQGARPRIIHGVGTAFRFTFDKN